MSKQEKFNDVYASMEKSIRAPSQEKLENWDCLKALEFGIDLLSTYYNDLVQDYPQLGWIGQWIETAKHLKPIDYSCYQYDFWGVGFSDLATKGFINSVQMLDEALQGYHGSPKSGEFCHDLISRAILLLPDAQFMYLWKSGDPHGFALCEKYTKIDEVPQEAIERIEASKGHPARVRELKQIWVDFNTKLQQALKE